MNVPTGYGMIKGRIAGNAGTGTLLKPGVQRLPVRYGEHHSGYHGTVERRPLGSGTGDPTHAGFRDGEPEDQRCPLCRSEVPGQRNVHLQDLPKNYPFGERLLHPGFEKTHQVYHVSGAERREVHHPDSRNYLGSRKEFDLDKGVIIEFCEFAVKFFGQVLGRCHNTIPVV